MSQRARRLAMAWAIGALALASTAEAARVESLFPTDRLTVADGEQATGRRVALPLPPCGADDAGCHEVQLLNQLDGFSVNPRLSLRFSGPIALATVRRESAFVLPVFGEPLPSPMGLVQLVWDEEQRTLYARTERALLQARRYALVITSRVLDIEGKPLQPAAELLGRGAVPAALEPALWARLDELRVSRREVVAVAVFTTQSVTRDLERIRALVDSRPAPTLSFRLEPGGGRSVYQRAALESIELRRQVSVVVGQLLGKPVTFPLPGGLRYPVIVKPSGEDASVGIDGGAVCEGPQALQARLATMGEHFSELLVQEYVAGREFNVGFLGSEAQPLSEISFAKMPPGAWPIVSYAAKWAEGSPEYLGTEPVCPAPVDESLGRAILTVARRAWQVLGGEGYGRVDIRVTEDGRPWVLEVNPNPDLSSDAGFARMGQARGWDYDALVGHVAEEALKRAPSRANAVLVEPPHGDEVAKPHVGRLVGDDACTSEQLVLRGRLVEQQPRRVVEDGPGVLHSAELEGWRQKKSNLPQGYGMPV